MPKLTVLLKDSPFHVDVVTSQKDCAVGLSKAASLPADGGMLFLFPEAKDASFHMTTCRVPLDMIGLDEESRVTRIHASCKPLTPGFYRFSRVAGVLEVPAGTCQRLGLGVGDTIQAVDGMDRTAEAHVFYHGTSLAKLPSILKSGLKAGRPSAREMQGVYLTPDFSRASRYGLGAGWSSVSTSDPESVPVVLEVGVPQQKKRKMVIDPQDQTDDAFYENDMGSPIEDDERLVKRLVSEGVQKFLGQAPYFPRVDLPNEPEGWRGLNIVKLLTSAIMAYGVDITRRSQVLDFVRKETARGLVNFDVSPSGTLLWKDEFYDNQEQLIYPKSLPQPSIKKVWVRQKDFSLPANFVVDTREDETKELPHESADGLERLREIANKLFSVDEDGLQEFAYELQEHREFDAARQIVDYLNTPEEDRLDSTLEEIQQALYLAADEEWGEARTISKDVWQAVLPSNIDTLLSSRRRAQLSPESLKRYEDEWMQGRSLQDVYKEVKQIYNEGRGGWEIERVLRTLEDKLEKGENDDRELGEYLMSFIDRVATVVVTAADTAAVDYWNELDPKMVDETEDGEEDMDPKTASRRDPIAAKLESLRLQFAQAAQKVYDAWDEENVDVYAGGGICHYIAEELADVCWKNGITCTTQSSSHEQHVYAVAVGGDGVFIIDIPYNVYETGAAYSWTKNEGVEFEPLDVVIDQVSFDPRDMKEFVDEWEDEEEWGDPDGEEDMDPKTAQIADESLFVEKMSKVLVGKVEEMTWTPDVLNNGATERCVVTRRELAQWLDGQAATEALQYILEGAATVRGMNLIGDAFILAGLADTAKVSAPGKEPVLVLYRQGHDRMAGLTGFKLTAGPDLPQRLKQKLQYEAPNLVPVVDDLAWRDPTAPRKYTYLNWMLREWKQGNQDADELQAAVLGFEKFKGDREKFPKPDIYAYSFEEVSEQLGQGATNAEVVYNKDGWRITQVFDYPTMCALGKERWCVSYTHTKQHWDSYMESDKGDVRLYLIEGPTRESPYLAYTDATKIREIKDNGNASIDASDTVFEVLSSALGLTYTNSVSADQWEEWTSSVYRFLESYLTYVSYNTYLVRTRYDQPMLADAERAEGDVFSVWSGDVNQVVGHLTDSIQADLDEVYGGVLPDEREEAISILRNVIFEEAAELSVSPQADVERIAEIVGRLHPIMKTELGRSFSPVVIDNLSEALEKLSAEELDFLSGLIGKSSVTLDRTAYIYMLRTLWKALTDRPETEDLTSWLRTRKVIASRHT